MNLRIKWFFNTVIPHHEQQMKTDDIVIIVDPNSKRNVCLIGPVIAVYKGSDRYIRSVCVRTGFYKKNVIKIANVNN